jgi:uncharacterized protein (DUF3084 family)
VDGLGRVLIILGIVLVVAGVLVSLGDRLPFRIGRLPGDLVYRGKNTTLYVPIVTSILLSVVLTLVLWLFNRSR